MPASTPPNRVYRFGEFRLLADERMLLRDGERVSLTPRVFELLLVLVENAGRLVSKETLLNRIWADSFVEEGNLNQTISRLRRALGERPNENRFIETVPRVGYRFIADVEAIEDNFAEPRTVLPKPAATVVVKLSEGREASVVPRRSRRPVLIAGAGLLIAGLAGGALWCGTRDNKPDIDDEPPKGPVQLTNDPAREEGPVFTREGDIRFIRWEAGLPRSFVMGADGSNQRRETAINGLQTGLWSPDGKKVIYSKEGDDSGSMYLVDANGANETKLPFPTGNMAWSADSSKLVIQSGRTDAHILLYTIATGELIPIVAKVGFEADPSLSPDGRSVVFVSDRDGNGEIYIQEIDGSNLRRLTNHPAHDEFPTFSPDGTQIVFNSNRADENFDVWVMNTDGSGLRRLTNWMSDEEIRPNCWSADGTQLLFASNRDGKGNIYKMDAEPFAPVKILDAEDANLHTPVYSPAGNKLVYVAEADNKSGALHVLDLETKDDKVILTSEVSEMHPAVSPDGRSIALQHRLDANAEICVISVDGGELRNLTNNPARDVQPSWSPDGSRIAFSSNREGNYDVFALYVLNADGTNQHRIYYSNAINSFPSWSPDGHTIAFSNDKEGLRTGNFEIFAIEPETVNAEQRLTARPRFDIDPQFSPDGRRITFASNTDGNWEIYLMNNDGSGLVRLTRHPGDDVNPSWSPDGMRVIFSSGRDGRSAIYEVTVDSLN
jgi:Tol biopolymer transport system component/DNA-binding winged helix-turn-helix (wHTH) protein